jgi:hypothetical protein
MKSGISHQGKKVDLGSLTAGRRKEYFEAKAGNERILEKVSYGGQFLRILFKK